MKKAKTKTKTKPKTSTGKKSAKPAEHQAAPAKIVNGKVNKQPQDKQQAAVAQAVFLSTDDAWSLRYFDPNDLHSKEREVFG